MRSVNHQEINVTLSAATFSRLEQANLFNKPRPAEQAIAVIRAALFELYPPHTPDEWKDKSRYQGATRHMLLTFYDLVCYALRKLTGRPIDRSINDVAQPTQLTLKVPIGLVKWLEKIAHDQGITIRQATVFAIDYGHRVLDSQPKGAESLRKIWREIIHAIWKRFVSI